MSETTLSRTDLVIIDAAPTTEEQASRPTLTWSDKVASHPFRDTAPTHGNVVVRRLRSLGADVSYVLLSLPVSLVAFTVVLTGLTAAIPLLIIGVGLPIAVGTLALARGLGTVELARIAHRDAVSGRLPQDRAARQPRATGTPTTLTSVRGLLAEATRADSWCAAAHALTSWIVSIFTFVVTVTWVSVAVCGSLYWVWDGFVTTTNDFSGFSENARHALETLSSTGFIVGTGVFFLLTLLPMTRAMANLQAASGRALLAPRR